MATWWPSNSPAAHAMHEHRRLCDSCRIFGPYAGGGCGELDRIGARFDDNGQPVASEDRIPTAPEGVPTTMAELVYGEGAGL